MRCLHSSGQNNCPGNSRPLPNFLIWALTLACMLGAPNSVSAFGIGLANLICTPAITANPYLPACQGLVQNLVNAGLYEEVHQKITTDALTTPGYMKVVYTPPTSNFPYLAGSPVRFTPGAAMAIADANREVDKDQISHEKHCDDEYLDLCAARTQRLFASIAPFLTVDTTNFHPSSDYYIRGARLTIGETLHTIQDFFAHSSWTNSHSTDGPSAIPNPYIWIGPTSFAAQTIFNPCLQASGITPVLLDLNIPPGTSRLTTDVVSGASITSGYADSLYYLGLAPNDKCSHGEVNLSSLPNAAPVALLFEVIATQAFFIPPTVYASLPETGINKDFSIRNLFQEAHDQALFASQQFVLDVLNSASGADPDDLCMVMSNKVCKRAASLAATPQTLPATGGMVTLTATVVTSVGTPSGIPNPGGTVTFTENGVVLCKAMIVFVDGTTAKAVCPATAQSGTITAAYSGDDVYPSSSATVQVAGGSGSYQIVELPTLYFPVRPVAINNAGVVVAGASDPAFNPLTVLVPPQGGIQVLGGGSPASPRPINDAGQVLFGDSNHFYIYSPSGGFLDLGRSAGATLNAINNNGQVVGNYEAVCGGGFVYVPSTGIQNLPLAGVPPAGTPGLFCTNVSDINDAGQIALSSTTGATFTFPGSTSPSAVIHAFIYTLSGGKQDLGTLGGVFSSPYFMNNKGQVIGASYGNGPNSFFLYTPVIGMQDFCRLVGVLYCNVTGMNNQGQVVGSFSSNQYLPFLYSPQTGAVDVNKLLPSGSGWTVDTVSGINDKGQMIGFGIHNGNNVGFLMTPQ